MIDIKEDVRKSVKKYLAQNKSISEADTKKIVKEIIDSYLVTWESYSLLPNFDDSFHSEFKKRYQKKINSIIKDVFENIPIIASNKTKLYKIASSMFCKNRFPTTMSGIVIAGFGENDIYPSLLSYNLEFRIDSKLKYMPNASRSVNINEKTSASIVPFAQSEMVHTFMQGVDPDLQEMSQNYLTQIFTSYPSIIVSCLGITDDKARNTLLKKVKKESESLYNRFRDEMQDYQKKVHVDPILDMVEVLPKDELASMAEALVNLTSFKRRVTMVTETVGGPIDVAVISKGDGFIWIQRKHYFEPALNHHFFSNYYRG